LIHTESGRPAVTFNNHTYSYGELGKAVAKLSAALHRRDVRRRDTVAIMLPNSPHFIIAHLAILNLGAISVPIHVQTKAREMADLVEDSECSVVIAWDHLSEETEKALAGVDCCRLRIYLGDNVPEGAESLLTLMSGSEEWRQDAPPVAEDVAVIHYTSGVTGRPRGVELTHANYAASALELSRLIRIHPGERCLTTLPFSSISGMALGMHFPLYCGAELVTLSRYHPGDLMETLRERETSMVVANPGHYALLASFPGAEKMETSRIRYPMSLDAKLSADVAREVEEKLRLHLFEAYGTTETCGPVCMNLFPGLMGRDNVGSAIGGTEIQICGEDGSWLGPGKQGQIAVRGSTIMRGYRNRPEKSRQAIRDGWFFTGDIGYSISTGGLVVVGHSAEVIMKGGFSVHSTEVERIIEGLPHVREVGVVGIADTLYGEEIKACVVLKEGASISPTEIVEYAKERMAVYKCPKIVKFYKELPREPNGKLRRNELREDRT
jgi:long-chain acyl-CoA synthetase